MPTLYDNFERVRQYIDQQTGGSIDLSSYVTKDELSAQSYLTSIPSEYITQDELSANSYLTQHQDLSGYVSKSELSAQSYATTSDLNAYLPLEGGTISGRLVSDYYTTVNASGGIDSYSSVLTGGDNRNSVTMFATRRLCGDTSYAAAFFTNSDGRSKFTHKTKTSEYSISGADDAFMCFNAYGFKIAYSGEQGVGATTEYEILHEGNIGNLGYITSIPSEYITQAELSANSYLTQHQDLSGYVSKSELNNASYATTTDLNNHLPYLGTLQAHYTNSEHFIPKTNNTYYLGNINFKWQLTYTYNLFTENLYSGNLVLSDTYNSIVNVNNTRINFQINQNNRFKMTNVEFAPVINNAVNLGTSTEKFNRTYTTNIYADNAYISNYNNLIWTGTSGEYAALDNYTTYQIYLIQEA